MNQGKRGLHQDESELLSTKHTAIRRTTGMAYANRGGDVLELLPTSDRPAIMPAPKHSANPPVSPVPVTPSQSDGPPKEVPPPTPIHFPQCRPDQPDSDPSGSDAGSEAVPVSEAPHLTTLLQGLVRPADQVQVSHLEALGVCVVPDASLADIIPLGSHSNDQQADWSLPPFEEWDTLSREESMDYARDCPSRPKLCNGTFAPGPAKYVDLCQGLLTENERAFRAVRRVTPRPGEQYVRLGYCHGFFQNLEPLTMFWDDTSIQREDAAGKPAGDEPFPVYRTSAGTAMPAPFRTKLLNSFLKLVTYDFNCNIMSRQEPRLYLKSPACPSSSSTTSSSTSQQPPAHRRSHFSSGCSFIYRMPLDRDSAKRGIIEGPIAAVSPRHTTSFPPLARDRESVIDLSREIIAALITAQHRARERRVEARIGKDAWWATRRRWGGGPGGPIGKEAELLEAKEVGAVVVGDKDERPPKEGVVVEGDGSPSSSISCSTSTNTKSYTSRPSFMGSRSSRFKPSTPPYSFTSSSSSRDENIPSGSGGGSGSGPAPKRPRTGLAIYDAYRMVRPPSLQWDPKTRYEAIGRQRGVDFDDVFVISSLFHHIAILRVRVPDRLLAVLDGGPEGEKEGDDNTREGGERKRGREKLEIWRTKWYDFFVAQDRVEAMKAVWAVMAYAMRDKDTADKSATLTSEGQQQGSILASTHQGPHAVSGVASKDGQEMDIDSSEPVAVAQEQ